MEKQPVNEEEIIDEEEATDIEGEPYDDIYDDEEESESDRIWEEFINSDYDQQAAIIEKIISDPDLLASFDCFELFNTLYVSYKPENNYDVFEKLSEKLKQVAPDEFKDVCGYLLRWQIDCALGQENLSKAETLFLQLSDNAGTNIDIFNTLLDQMACYSSLDVMLNALHRGWETVKKSSEIVQWGLDKYALLASKYEIFKYITGVSSPNPEEAQFLQKLEKFIDPDMEIIKSILPYLTGTKEKEWEIQDFNYQQPKSKQKKKKKKSREDKNPGLPIEAFSNNVYYLSLEFTAHLVKTHEMPFPKAEIAGSELSRYILERAQGKLVEKPSMLEAVISQGSKHKKQPVTHFDHILCPDKNSLDIFLGSMLSFFNFRLHRAIISFECLPAWLQFLESKGLINSDIRYKTLASVYLLFENIKQVIKNESKDDRHLIEKIEKAYSMDPGQV